MRDYKTATDRLENWLIGYLDAKPRATGVTAPPRPRGTRTACYFECGPVTAAMARHAEAISEFYYRKRLARNADQRRAP